MAYWLLPPGIHQLLQRRPRRSQELRSPSLRALLARNEIWRDYHAHDRRCFIIASGPSIKSQDLTLLRNEICISVSNSYVHKDYSLIRLRYHCVPFIGGHKQITTEDAIRWLRDMEERTDPATMFFSYRDKELIECNGLFRHRSLYYLHDILDVEAMERSSLDLTRSVLSPQSVSIMALVIAVFMGFRQIYLLGCDHDWILHWGISSHFYSRDEHTILARPGYREWLETDDYEMGFRNNLTVWGQYKAVKREALAKDVRIYNATAGGLLDVFPRVEYESLF